jgi:hypothetical protein
MKKTYEKPNVEVENFEPNEYIAACYAIVDVNNEQNFTIKGGWNGQYTDGENGNSDGIWHWNSKGFDDDHFDYLDSPTWGESHTGLFYDGPGMTHTTQVSSWEANQDTVKNATMVDHMATQVKIVQLTDANSGAYGSSANAS